MNLNSYRCVNAKTTNFNYLKVGGFLGHKLRFLM